MRLIVFLVLSHFSVLLSAQGIGYLSVMPNEGEGVFSLLRRYNLEAYDCNHKQFYNLNKLKPGDGLVKGSPYLLPIQQHTYNNRSIRSTINIDDFDLAMAIKNYNDTLFTWGIKKSGYLVDRDLWVPHHFLNCYQVIDPANLSGEQPTANLPGDYPIFGEKYKKVEKISDELKGHIYYIVAGHGGPDPGAIGQRETHNLCEDEYAYDVALRLTRYLLARGAIAYMIIRDPNDGIRDDRYLQCDQDEVAWGDRTIPLNQIARLKQRSAIVNQRYEHHKSQGVKHQTSIFIHVDSNNKGKRQDVFFYHLTKSKESKEIAETIHETFHSKYKQHQANRGYKGTVTGRDLYVLRETRPYAVYIELANIRNPDDQRRIIIPENREALAKWLAEALLKARK